MTDTIASVSYPRQFADTCDCQWAKSAPEFHDRFVGFEDGSVAWGGLLLLNVACLGDFEGQAPELGNDPDEFERFDSQHNWRDPVGMALIAQAMSHVSNGYWKGVGPREGRVCYWEFRRYTRLKGPDPVRTAPLRRGRFRVYSG